MHDDKKTVVTLNETLLWARLHSEAQELVPLEILKRVKTVYEGAGELDPTVNPVCKVLLLISDCECQLIIEELFCELEQAEAVAGTARDENSSPVTHESINRRQSSHSSDMQAVIAQLMMIRKQNEELTSEIQSMMTTFSKKLGYL